MIAAAFSDVNLTIPARTVPLRTLSLPAYTLIHISGEAKDMKNITVSIDEETHRHARIKAAELGTSVSALVRGYLRTLVTEPVDVTKTSGQDSETESERRRRLLNEVISDFDARGVGLRMADNLPREALYDRDAARAEAEAERRRRMSA